MPISGTALISVNNKDKFEVVSVARALYSTGFKLMATGGTCDLIEQAGIPVKRVKKLYEGRPNILDYMTNGKIQLIINSPGGEVLAGLYLYDQLKGMKVPIDIYCAEMAASMAAILLAAGKKGHRFILKHSKVMIHEPLISSSSGGISGSASSIAKSAESIMQTKRDLVAILSQDTGRSEKEIEKAVSYDNFMTAEEAVKFGICDKIVERI